MDKHTPGPWTAVVGMRDNRSRYYEVKRSTMALDPNIAVCDSAADARLIAAAPELLEALKWAARELQEAWDEDIPLLDRIIAKAEVGI